MKEIPNVQYTEKDSTVSLLLTSLNFTPREGLDFAMIRARNRVADVVEKVNPGEVIKLEDADYQTAREAIKAVRWAGRDKHLAQFGEAFGL